jgi:hypothetical protein
MTSSVAFTSDVVPETLLALAKDERYVHQCHELLKEILPRDSCPAGLSWLLYALLVVRRTNKTLGMEFCGLSVTDATSSPEAVPGSTKAGNGSSDNRLWKLMALSAVISMAIEWQFSKPDDVHDAGATASDALRGRARQMFHQRQRQAMLQRATQTVQELNVVSESTGHSSMAQETGVGTLQFRELFRKVKDVVKSTLLDLSVSTVAQEGPHRIVTTRQGPESLSKWIIRLALVRFLIYGNFSIWNLFGIRLKKDHNNLLSNRPNLHRFVALLYLQQAATAGLLGVVHAMTKYWVQRNRRRNVPRNVPQTLEVPDTHLQLTLPSDMSCGICKLPRSDPAISSNCGHVFCWKCLYQWTSTVRQECPLCRTACRPQEILALYRYRPS